MVITERNVFVVFVVVVDDDGGGGGGGGGGSGIHRARFKHVVAPSFNI